MKRKIAELLNIIFGFRKFILMLLVTLIAVSFRVKGLVSGTEMVDLLKATVLGFFGANGIEHIMGVAKDYVAAKNAANAPQTVADTDDSNDEEDVEVSNG